MDESRKVLRPRASAAFCGLSVATIYRLEKKGELAPRLRLGPNASGWYVRDLEIFLASRPRGSR